jgi:hypothetical protein
VRIEGAATEKTPSEAIDRGILEQHQRVPDILKGGAWVLADYLHRDSKQSGRSSLGGIRLDEDSRWRNAELVGDRKNGSGEYGLLSR